MDFNFRAKNQHICSSTERISFVKHFLRIFFFRTLTLFL